MRSVAALCAAGLLSLIPALALAQHRGPEGHGGGRPHGGPVMRPVQGPGPGGHGGNPYAHGGVVVRGGPGPVVRGGPGPYARGGRVSLDGVISQMHRRYPGGRLLDAGVETWGGRTVYRVRWSSGDGRRIDYLVDAQTGEIVGKED